MLLFTHLSLFLLAIGVIWFFGGILVNSIDRIAKRFKVSGFTISFFVLGILTSISEFSVALNSTLNDIPQVSAGNLAGASFVILLLIIPVLAITGGGIDLNHTFNRRTLPLALIAIGLPVLFALDGDVRGGEGLIIFLVIGILIWLMRRSEKGKAEQLAQAAVTVRESIAAARPVSDFLKIFVGGAFIFLAGHLLVEEAVFLANYFTVPASIIGLLLLSIGTNVPELVVAARSVIAKRNDIAFGDYMGSATVNSLIFAFLPLINGKFLVEQSEFVLAFIATVLGLGLFWWFSRSKHDLSRREGMVLLVVYALFLVSQIANFIRLA